MTKASVTKIQKIKDQLQEIHDLETEKFESKSEKWQENDAAEHWQQNLDCLQQAIDELENIEFEN